MVQYIDKSAVVAEIERRQTNIKEYCVREGHDRRFDVVPEQLAQILSFLDTIEVKEIDLEKELDKYTADNFWALEGNNESPYLVEKDDMLKVARHFFELGLKAQKGEQLYE